MSGGGCAPAEAKNIELQGSDDKLAVSLFFTNNLQHILNTVSQHGNRFIRFGNDTGIRYTKPLSQFAVRFTCFRTNAINVNACLNI